MTIWTFEKNLKKKRKVLVFTVEICPSPDFGRIYGYIALYSLLCELFTIFNTSLSLLLPHLQALEYLFKFIVQSRILYSRATCGMEEEQFRSSIQELFQSIRFVLSLDSRNSETLLFTQVCELQGSFAAGFLSALAGGFFVLWLLELKKPCQTPVRWVRGDLQGNN